MTRRVQQLAVILRIHNSTFSLFALMLVAAFISLIMINASMAVKYLAVREGLTAVIMCALCMALFKTMGEVYETSRDVYGRLSGLEVDSAILRRYRKAYRPLRIDIGSVGYADMMLCLTILSTILENTVNLVMTTD